MNELTRRAAILSTFFGATSGVLFAEQSQRLHELSSVDADPNSQFHFSKFPYTIELDATVDGHNIPCSGDFGKGEVRVDVAIPTFFMLDYHLRGTVTPDKIDLRLRKGMNRFIMRRLIQGTVEENGLCSRIGVYEASLRWHKKRPTMFGHGRLNGNRPYMFLDGCIPEGKYDNLLIDGKCAFPRLELDIFGYNGKEETHIGNFSGDIALRTDTH